jgi:rhodanese-related sulfurtransferase
MSIVIESPSEVISESETILAKARENAQQVGLRYAGDISPSDAWNLFENGDAKLVDVRTIEERQSVGYVPESIHVAWAIGNPMVSNPRFVRELEIKAGKLDVILLLCRSGKRSVAAAETVSRLGFKNVFNITEGFEGDSNLKNGWVNRNLPWVKD